ALGEGLPDLNPVARGAVALGHGQEVLELVLGGAGARSLLGNKARPSGHPGPRKGITASYPVVWSSVASAVVTPNVTPMRRDFSLPHVGCQVPRSPGLLLGSVPLCRRWHVLTQALRLDHYHWCRTTPFEILNQQPAYPRLLVDFVLRCRRPRKRL